MARKNRKRKSKYVLSTITEKRLDKYADFSLDDTIKNIICDAGIQTALLKEVIPETMGLSTDSIKNLLCKDINGIEENEQIILLDSVLKNMIKPKGGQILYTGFITIINTTILILRFSVTY